MKLFAICDSVEDKFAGPYTNPTLAGIVLKIFEMAIDEQSEICTVESDEFAEQLLAGYKPWEIDVTIDLRSGKVLDTNVHPCWPPHDTEGIIENREGFRRYFFWAKTRTEAIGKLGRVKVPANDGTTRVITDDERKEEEAFS